MSLHHLIYEIQKFIFESSENIRGIIIRDCLSRVTMLHIVFMLTLLICQIYNIPFITLWPHI